MATNYGMLNNIASGVKEAMTAYQTNKTLQRQEQMQNLLQGAQENPETGELEYTPEMKMRKDAEMKGLLAKQNESVADSEESKSARALAKANGLLVPDTMTAAQLKEYSPILTAKMKDEYLRNALASKTNAAEDKRNNKSIGDERKTFHDTQQMLEQMRGNPAVQQAEKDMYSAEKADKLFNKYKDPNQMNSQEVQLYASEIAKMATGGVPTTHELQGLNPSTIPGALAQAAQRFNANPTPAQAGEFMKLFKGYSDDLKESAKNVITDRYGRILESNKDYLGENNYAKLKKTYMGRFGEPSESSPGGKGLIQQSTGQTVKVFDPKGNVRIIPKDQLDAAIKAGGKLAE